jgi:hypothetical protein
MRRVTFPPRPSLGCGMSLDGCCGLGYCRLLYRRSLFFYLHLRLGSSPLCRPHLLCGSDDCSPTSGTEFSLRLWRFLYDWRFSFAFCLCPPCFLSQCHLSPYGSAEFLALSRSGFGWWGVLSGITGQHRPKFGDLIVNPALLRLEAFDGSGDDFLGEFWWHCGFRRMTSVPLSVDDFQRTVVTGARRKCGTYGRFLSLAPFTERRCYAR